MAVLRRFGSSRNLAMPTLQARQSNPRTRPVAWSWSTSNDELFGGVPQIAHPPPWTSIIRSYSPNGRPKVHFRWKSRIRSGLALRHRCTLAAWRSGFARCQAIVLARAHSLQVLARPTFLARSLAKPSNGFSASQTVHLFMGGL